MEVHVVINKEKSFYLLIWTFDKKLVSQILQILMLQWKHFSKTSLKISNISDSIIH